MGSKYLRWMVMTMLFVFLLSACGGAAQPGSPAGDTPPALPGTQWVLTSLQGSQPIEGSEVTLNFTENEINGRAGCNSYSAQYSIGSDGTLSIGPAVQTEMACMEPEGIMDQESAFTQALTQAASFQVVENRLEIKNAGGETILVFNPAAANSN